MISENNIEIYEADDGQTQIEMQLNQGLLWLSKSPTALSSTTEEFSVVRRSKEHSGRRSFTRSSKFSTNRDFRIVQIKKLNSESPISSLLQLNMVH